MTRTVLSVDWDFFVREDPLWDWSHGEDEFYRDTIWAFREMVFAGDMRSEMDPSQHAYPLPTDFWRRLGLVLTGAKVVVADSHRWAYDVFGPYGNTVEPLSVLHLDAHADLGYHQTTAALKAENDPEAGSWLFHTLRDSPRSVVHIYYPRWKGFAELEGDTLPWLSTEVAKRVMPHIFMPTTTLSGSVDTVFVARSGGWSPPWLDQAFMAFVQDLEQHTGTPVSTPYDEGCNVLGPRMTKG